MKHRILWMLMSFLLVAALVLTSCAKEEVPGEQEEEEEEEPVGQQEEEEEEEPVGEQEEEEPAVGEPQYGGTLTVQTFRVGQDIASWDQADGHYSLMLYANPFAENLLTGDVEKYGPRGTNEFAFELKEYVPDPFLRGQLAESWELTTDPLGVLFHIRPGCMFTANPNWSFEAREFTAYDAEFVGNRYRPTVPGIRWLGFMPEEGAFEATDRYTLQAHFTYFYPEWGWSFGYGLFNMQYPPEMVEAGAADWKNQTGTGPFILADYVKGSQVVYKRNPNWWDKEKVIQGKKYDAPFIDELVYPIIVDPSTRIASLRTGKLDIAHVVELRYKDILSSTCPELIVMPYRAGNYQYVAWQGKGTGPTTDRNLRRALMIGTDIEAIVRATLTEGDLHSCPFSAAIPTSIYTPIEDLPPSTRELFTYDPEKAARMIAADYPDGLTLTVDYSATRAELADVAPMLEGMWAKIGVELILQPHDDAVFEGINHGGTYEHAILNTAGNAGTITRLNDVRSKDSLVLHYDEWFNEQIVEAATEMDEAKRNAVMKELGIYVIDEAALLPLGTPYLLSCYWPWVKNYYGETESGWTNYTPFLSTLWIDQELKEDMGY